MLSGKYSSAVGAISHQMQNKNLMSNKQMDLV
jgi:hypothetical protein